MKRTFILTALIAISGICVDSFSQDGATPVPDMGESAVIADANSSVIEQKSASANLPSLEQIAPELERLGGTIGTFRQKNRLFWEISSEQLSNAYIVLTSVSRGIGEPSLYGGQSLFENDMVWRFKKVDDRIQIIRRNDRYRADSGPDTEAMRVAFTDSILFSLPIIARGPNGGDVVDVTSLFMGTSLYRLSVPGRFASDRSTWEKIKGFKDNLEIEIAATFDAGSPDISETVIDGRGICVNIHYSISKLKDTGYQPRYADERVGYFLTAVRNLSNNSDDDNFERYITRWNLQKLEPKAEKSLPKKPIVYWLDKATPYKYRKALRDGILEWNKAFEKAGFYNAVEVRQQEDNDEWDAEDVNYNTIRWSMAQTGFSIGPSRINPLTGEILDADVVLSVGFLNSWAFEADLYKETFDRSLPEQTRNSEMRAFEELDFTRFPNNSRMNGDLEAAYAFTQQMGLAELYFDSMLTGATSENAETFDVVEENSTETPEQVAKREELSKTAQKASEAAAVAQKAAEDAKKVAEEAKVAGATNYEELNKKANDAEYVAKTAFELANEAAKKLDALRADVDALKQAENKRAEEAKLAEEQAKSKAEEEAKVAANAKAQADAKAKKEELKKRAKEEHEKMVDQALRQLVCHEVGHTLGLRHSFKQSALHSLEEINDPSKWTEYGFVGSIMEYAPVNIMPKGKPQGDYYSHRLGKYDEWVIEYGYKPFGKSTKDEVEDLKKIAARQSKPEYEYATDEDCYGKTPDPYVNVWDLGSSPLEYAKSRVELINQLIPTLRESVVEDGESYNKLYSRFAMLNHLNAQAMAFAVKYIGGLQIRRDFKGDEGNRKPFEVVPAKDQREALQFLIENVFSKDASRKFTDLYNYLAPNRWSDWGSRVSNRYDKDIHGELLSAKIKIADYIFNTPTLSRIIDAELRTPEGEDVLTIAEIYESVDNAVYAEYFEAAKKLEENKDAQVELVVSSQRRNFQYKFFRNEFIWFLESKDFKGAGFEEAFNLAYVEMLRIHKAISAILSSDRVSYKNSSGRGLDPYGKAWLSQLNAQIERTLKVCQKL